MINRMILVLVFMFFAVLGPGCSDHSEPAEEVSAQEQIRPLKMKKPGAGLGRNRVIAGRGYGRRAGRIWSLSDSVQLTKEETEAIDLKTVEVQSMPLQSFQTAMGKVLEHKYRKAIVSYAFSARVAERHVREGDWVRKGQKLITLQSEEVGNAKSEFYKAKADFDLAQINYERQKRLFSRGVGAQKDYLSAEAEYKVAEASLNAVEKKLHVLGFDEQQVKEIAATHQINPVITLFAPISGKVIHDNVVLGAMIDQSTELLTLMDPTFLHIDAEVYEKDISKMVIGQSVEVEVIAYPEEVFRGKISYISDILNPETRTITIRTEVENRDFKLKPGMFAEMKILLNHAQNALVVPMESVLDDRDDKIVFIKNGEVFLPVLVTVGAEQDGFLEIKKGLEQGDVVVTQGNFQLKSKLYEDVLEKSHVH